VNRRVGTLTLGLMLILFGVLFISRLFFPDFDYNYILKLWPLILISLGAEVIAAYIINKPEKISYDAAAIVLVFCISFFTVIMAGLEIAVTHFHNINL
jgi:O-antigen/teichoic acid export membrane protein